jgi:hypothetical protein
MSTGRIRAIAITAGLVLGLSGCVRISSDVTLHEDNTVSGEILLAIQEGVDDQEGISEELFGGYLGEGGAAESMVNATVSPYSEDGYVGSRIIFTDEPIESFKGLDGSLVRDGDTFVFTGSVPQYAGEASSESDAIAIMSLTFPGKVSKHNGTRVGNTVSWDLLTQTDAPFATGSAIVGGGSDDDDGNSNSAFFIVIGGVFIAAIVIGGVILLRRRGGASPADETPPGIASTS